MAGSSGKDGDSLVVESRLSMATENYLLSIYRLEEQGIRVTLTQLSDHFKTFPVAEGMGTSLPSVGGMIRRMVREGLVDTSSKKDMVLTRKGLKSAESIVRRHRLAERMVVDLLDVDLAKSHAEAHRLEHAISPQLEERIDKRLGYPITCPFGHPIPRSGYISNKDSVSLGEARSGQRLVIDRIPEDDQDLLEYLVDKKLIPGQVVIVMEVAPTRGVVTLSCSDEEVVFSYEVAAKIRAYPDGGV